MTWPLPWAPRRAVGHTERLLLPCGWLPSDAGLPGPFPMLSSLPDRLSLLLPAIPGLDPVPMVQIHPKPCRLARGHSVDVRAHVGWQLEPSWPVLLARDWSVGVLVAEQCQDLEGDLGVAGEL
ncbi:hypothetical protein TREES_T100001692 [Tupaia chinensis]|uniref:Uncharacterized protein n=1 Tax=Tupaia chinensis TaxID=246437 RepID=L9KJG5_TUPCH|nr:hypothetical protein TREES_T100001692 [Tupaia chinensis]